MTTFKRYTGTAWEYVNLPITNSGPAATLAYASITATTGTLGPAESDIPGLSVTFTVPEGRRIKVTGYAHARSSVATDTVYVRIVEDANSRNFALVNETGSTPGTGDVVDVWVPTAGTHTVKLRVARQAGSGNVTVYGAALEPSYIIVEDVTGSTLPYNAASVPVGQLARGAMAGNQAIAATASPGTDITGLSINIAVPAGRVIRLVTTVAASSTVNNDEVILGIFEGATQVQAVATTLVVQPRGERMICEAIVTPTAGAHVYRATMWRNNGTGAITAQGDAIGTTYPSFIYAEDITPTPAAGTGAPGSTLGYAEVTANQGSITTQTDLTGLSVNVNVPAGRRLRITGVVLFSNTASGNQQVLTIQEDGANIRQAAIVSGAVTTTESCIAIMERTPTAGAHTYKLQASAAAGTTTMTAGASNQAFILVEDITGAIWPVGSPVTTSLFSSEAWLDYLPTLTQSVTVTHTVNYSRYIKLGRTVTWVFRLTVTGAGTTNNRISLNLPFVAFGFANLQGAGSVYDNSTTTNYVCAITSAAASAANITFEIDGVSTDGWGVSPNLALAANDVVRGSITYEAVS